MDRPPTRDRFTMGKLSECHAFLIQTQQQKALEGQILEGQKPKSTTEKADRTSNQLARTHQHTKKLV
jgi:hypothetical protein